MRVLADYHHHDLFESLEILFEDRFGWELYRPIGMEWFHEGYWNFERQWHGDAVAKQYLEPWGSDDDGFRLDLSHNRYQRLLSLEQALDLKPDIVIASVAHNHDGLHRFANKIGARFGLQLGNVRFDRHDMAEDRWDLAQFGLVSTVLPEAPEVPHVVYHQEFSLQDFRYEPPHHHERPIVSSFVNCFAENARGYADFRDMAARFPTFDWRVYGSYGSVAEDEYACGNINLCSGVAAQMRESDIAWHTKQWSDGYGHVIHNWFATGRPVFGYEGYYKNQLAGPLWIDGVTSYNIESRTKDEVAELIKRVTNDPELHERMSAGAAARFREVVNFDHEAEAIKAMFEAVL